MATIFIETKSNISEEELIMLIDTFQKRIYENNEFIVYPGTTKDLEGFKLHVILKEGEKLVSVNGISDVCVEKEKRNSKLEEFFHPRVKAEEMENW